MAPRSRRTRKICRLQGCSRRASLQFPPFCCPEHEQMAQACKERTTRDWNATESQDLHGTRHELLNAVGTTGEQGCINPGFRLHVMAQFKHIADFFFTAFHTKKKIGPVTVKGCYEIEAPQRVRERFENYTTTVSKVLSLYHGTSCSSQCAFAMGDLCLQLGGCACNLCGILKKGIKIRDNVGQSPAKKWKQNNWLTYGKGAYFTGMPGKARMFSETTEKPAGNGRIYGCMLICAVAVGKEYFTNKNRLPDHMCPPVGHNSVARKVGRRLRDYNEVAVYSEAAVLPTHLVIYERGAEQAKS
ncbi:unnamed protein product [Ectocarpus fasciculatus]